MKIGIMFGNPETTTGGNALKFYASIRMDVRRIEALKDGTNVIGNRTKVKVVKNKVAPPFKEVQFDILYNEGISKLGDLIDVAVEQNIINKSGSWFSYKDDRIGQGRDAVKAFLTSNASIAQDIDREVRKKLGLIPSTETPAPEAKERPKEAPKKTVK
jgi:recombination protein RecA